MFVKNQKSKKVFRSRISVLLLGILLAVLIPMTIPLIKDMTISSNLFIIGGTILLIILLLSGMRYVISDNKLHVQIWVIPCGSADIADIISIKRSYNLLSSPAASLKRLQIGIGRGTIFSDMLISPVREQEFIECLKAINPNISVNVPAKTGAWRIQDWDI